MDSEPSPARLLMERFADAAPEPADTDGPRPQARRYLWTDAFAVCNWLGLGEVERARALVDQVHQTLGRHRHDDPRTGWISGLPEEEAARRPTTGGLRIGKPLPERGADEPYQPQMEWERDGQYFHYLTRWIRALERVSAATGEDTFHRWAAELGVVAFDGFSHGIGPVPNRLYWKMSIDLSRPLVASMGQHDPLDGYVALREVRARGDTMALDDAIDALAGMVDAADLVTQDPLGAGALLTDALFLARLGRGDEGSERSRIIQRVLHAASISLREIRDTRFLDLPATRRLAFRELGLAIGLDAADRLRDTLARTALDETLPADAAGALDEPSEAALDGIREAAPMRDAIVAFWLDEANQETGSWGDHRDINTVMLATAVAPDGYLDGAEPHEPRPRAEH